MPFGNFSYSFKNSILFYWMAFLRYWINSVQILNYFISQQGLTSGFSINHLGGENQFRWEELWRRKLCSLFVELFSDFPYFWMNMHFDFLNFVVGLTFCRSAGCVFNTTPRWMPSRSSESTSTCARRRLEVRTWLSSTLRGCPSSMFSFVLLE